MTRPVDWIQTMQSMRSLGVRTLVELGPGRVLGSLAVKYLEDVRTWNADELFVFEPEEPPAES
jgi:malonyl CoA-acyl carrier protein transacylase